MLASFNILYKILNPVTRAFHAHVCVTPLANVSSALVFAASTAFANKNANVRSN